MTKIEKILRSDYTLHFLMMFFVISVLMYFFRIPFLLLIILCVVPPVVWEIWRKLGDNRIVDPLDIVISIIGGFLAIVIMMT